MKPLTIIIAITVFLVIGNLINVLYLEGKEGLNTCKIVDVVSAVEEEQRCTKLGGRLDTKVTFFGEYWNSSKLSRMSCIKQYTEGNKNITETIFDYKF